jgi:hypothetical protein
MFCICIENTVKLSRVFVRFILLERPSKYIGHGTVSKVSGSFGFSWLPHALPELALAMGAGGALNASSMDLQHLRIHI